jgi:hypothetical protein
MNLWTQKYTVIVSFYSVYFANLNMSISLISYAKVNSQVWKQLKEEVLFPLILMC